MKANPTAMKSTQPKIGALQLGIVLLAIATAVIHIGLALAAPNPMFTPLFLANGAGYLVLLAGLFLPLPYARDHRGQVRWALIAFTAVTILAWLVVGEKSWPAGAMGYVTKAIELLLIVLLFMDNRR